MALVDEVKNRSDILQVISEYVDLDVSSRQPKALCPFHVERTPSFVIYPDTGSWRCYGGCSEGGDVISFVMKKENMSFAQALENLADRAGIKGDVFDKNVSKVSIIGVGMVTTPGVTYRMFQSLAKQKINIQVISTSEIKISVLIDKKNVRKAISSLHKEFKLNN